MAQDRKAEAVKASDISDEQFLEAMRETMQLRPGWVTRWDLANVLDGHPERVYGQPGYDGSELAAEATVPQKVVLAKARRLIDRGLITGCACGCRGGFEFPADTA